jgi:exosortase
MSAPRPVVLVPLIPTPNQQAQRSTTAPANVATARGGSAGTGAISDEPLLDGCRRRLREWVAEVREPQQRAAWLTTLFLTCLLIYSYWPGLMNASASWGHAQYSHGGLVPLCSLALLFWWRRPLDQVNLSARLAGLALLTGGFLLRLFCARYRIVTIDMYTFVPALAGVVLLAGGWGTLRWAWAPILMLIFMYPLPEDATRYLLGPLQTMATMTSTFALQVLGYDAYREGNRIVLGEDHVLGVVDACSGLRMLTIFVWLCVLLALVGNGEWWENLVIVASAVPIALIVNSARITVTGVMYTINPEIAEKIFHDWAGYFMMPLAIALLYSVQAILRWVVISESSAVVRVDRPGPVEGGGFGAAGPGGVSAARAAASGGRFPTLVGDAVPGRASVGVTPPR